MILSFEFYYSFDLIWLMRTTLIIQEIFNLIIFWKSINFEMKTELCWCLWIVFHSCSFQSLWNDWLLRFKKMVIALNLIENENDDILMEITKSSRIQEIFIIQQDLEYLQNWWKLCKWNWIRWNPSNLIEMTWRFHYHHNGRENFENQLTWLNLLKFRKLFDWW